jgi:hypothetical protein
MAEEGGRSFACSLKNGDIGVLIHAALGSVHLFVERRTNEAFVWKGLVRKWVIAS